MLQLLLVLVCSILIANISAQSLSACKIDTKSYTLDLDGTSGMKLEDVKSFVESMNYSFVDPRTQYLSCIEARSNSGILGTSGGDTGEFLIALSIYNENGGNLTDDTRVYTLFDSFIKSLDPSRQFYMHTDKDAYANLTLSSNISNFNINNVSLSDQSRILDLLIKPENIGCKVLRLLLAYPDFYRVPISITQRYIKAFFSWKWNNPTSSNRLIYQISDYNSDNTGAFINFVIASSNPTCKYSYPLITAKSSKSPFYQVLVNHPGAISIFRESLSNFFSNQSYVSGKSSPSAATFKNKMDRLSDVQNGQFTFNLIPDEPVYTVTLNMVPKDSSVTSGVTSGSGASTGVTTSAVKPSITTGTSTTTTGAPSPSPTPTPSKKSKGWVGVIVVLLLLSIFLSLTFIAWKYYNVYFPTHYSQPVRPLTGDTHPHRDIQKEDSEFVQLQDYND